ncbi:hypothetical protein [Actinomadura sp. DC4]|uniref:hypothetical protein n=1 Tax=Actinomadura sp. DC4 TaxID=3055069 RepID=UPI0025B088E7|nr:hypothetical protein [Actinomadura sp. DC4]MDN3356727.1 hypothetical protein [Actinomadura sp. DC4]
MSPDTGYDDFGLYDVAATGPQDAWAVGSRQQGAGATGALEHWNGQGWSDVTVPGSTGSFNHVDGSSPNNVWVTGATYNGAQMAWHWNGTTWTSTPLGAFNAADVAVIGPNNAWAVGNADEGSDTGTARHWNGTTWQTVPMPFVARRIAAASARDIWAVGENADQPLAEHWDGTAWTSVELPQVPIPDGQSGFAYFNDIVANSSTNVWAVGRLYYGSGGEELKAEESEHNQAVLMHWNGKKWKLQLGPDGDFALSASPDGAGGIWYSTFEHTFVHLAKGGATTTEPVAKTSDGRQAPSIRQLAGVPGTSTVLAVGEVAPAPGDDESWDALIEQYH